MIFVSQVAIGGQKTRIVMDIPTANEFHELLTHFCEHFAELGELATLHSMLSVSYSTHGEFSQKKPLFLRCFF